MPGAKHWALMVGALAVSSALVLVLVSIERSVREQRLAQEAEESSKALEALEGGDLPYRVFLEVAGVREATEEAPLAPGQRAAMRMEFLDLALYQRRQLEQLYLEVIRQLDEKNPRYLSLLDGRSGWPYDQFEIDFRAFRTDRARFERVWTGEDRQIDALLAETEGEMIRLLSDLAFQPGIFPEGRKRLLEKFEQLDEAIEAASIPGSNL